jgi:acyl-CoA synthetase (AMP-forming)/AMP-acid ligase II
MRVTEVDVLCNAPPLFHCFDESSSMRPILESVLMSMSLRLVLGNLAFWSQGAAVVYPSESFSAPEIVDALISEQCTALHGVPTHFINVLAEVESRRSAGHALDLSRMR